MISNILQYRTEYRDLGFLLQCQAVEDGCHGAEVALHGAIQQTGLNFGNSSHDEKTFHFE